MKTLASREKSQYCRSKIDLKLKLFGQALTYWQVAFQGRVFEGRVFADNVERINDDEH